MLAYLIEKCGAATGPDRGLDAAIVVATTPTEDRGDDLIYLRQVRKDDQCAPGAYWRCSRSGMSLHTAPELTASIDAALALVERLLPGWGIRLEANLGYGIWATIGHVGRHKLYDEPEGNGEGATCSGDFQCHNCKKFEADVDQALSRARSEAFGECAAVLEQNAAKASEAADEIAAVDPKMRSLHDIDTCAAQMRKDAEVIRARAGQTPATGWRDISTAPKDGTYILLSNEHGVWVGKYQGRFQSGYTPNNPWHSMMLNHRHMERYCSVTPTHWMPLPTPPMEKADAAD